MQSWFSIEITQIFGILMSTLLIYAGLIFIVRINGLRSFSKVSGHDFAVTVAIGSVLASTIISKDPSILQALLAIASLLLWRTLVSYARTHLNFSIFDNQAKVVMLDGEILKDALRKTNFTEDDLYAKLRESNVLNLGQVRAVVVETTGDFSVIHGEKQDYDSIMLKGVGQ